jgi:hypothetical protein
MNLKSKKVIKYWGENHENIDYTQMDQSIIKEFQGTHPEIIKNWLPKESGVYQADTNYQPNKKQKKHRLMIKLEKLFGIGLSKKHFKLI